MKSKRPTPNYNIGDKFIIEIEEISTDGYDNVIYKTKDGKYLYEAYLDKLEFYKKGDWIK